MRSRIALAVCWLCGLLTGCTTYDVHITAYLSHDLAFPPPERNIRIGVVTKGEPEQPLLEAEVKRKLEWLLSARGYGVGSVDDCDCLLTAFFAIDPGTTAYGTYPVYEPGGTVTTPIRSCRGRWVTRSTYFPGRTVYEPYSYTYFTRHLDLTLYERESWRAAGEKDLAQGTVWQAIASTQGTSSDLRRVLDYMLVASFAYFGQDTGRQVHETLLEGDQRVKALRTGSRGSRPQ